MKPSKPLVWSTACWRNKRIPNATCFGETKNCARANWQPRDLFAGTNGLATFGYRTRRLVINTNRLAMANAPHSLTELTNAFWRGKVALAYPLFGTTATHFLALRQHWGPERWLAWCQALAANQPFLVDGNSVVVKLVGRGEAWIGLTDSDDIAAGQREGSPVTALPVDAGTLYIPNALGRIRYAPHGAGSRLARCLSTD